VRNGHERFTRQLLAPLVGRINSDALKTLSKRLTGVPKHQRFLLAIGEAGAVWLD
jgi:hypothetical protein